MKIVQLKKTEGGNFEYLSEKIRLKNPLVLVFGNRALLENENIYNEIKSIFKDGHIVFGSTSGDIMLNSVSDNTITITAIEFERTKFEIKTSNVLTAEPFISSFETGKSLINQFSKQNLRYVFIVSEGSFVNGSQLAVGMNFATDNELLITGGLCGDDDKFESTLSSYNENPKKGEIVAIGFYGDSLEVSFATSGGWKPFGPERIVTKSKDNVLFELDGKPALDLYKTYLGSKANELPGAALLYPLNVKSVNDDKSIVRTILNIDEKENSMILAGDIKEGSTVQLMMTGIDNLVNAAETGAKNALSSRKNNPELAILISCIGRKLVLNQRVEEEVEEIIEVIGKDAAVCGFYSYGEIAPFNKEQHCQLHNQTMTVTLISE